MAGLIGIYHPPASTQQKTSNSNFIDVLTELHTTTGSENRNIMLIEDLNLQIDGPEDPDTNQLSTTMEAFGLKQHIKFPTHQPDNTLNLIATELTIQLTCPPIPG